MCDRYHRPHDCDRLYHRLHHRHRPHHNYLAKTIKMFTTITDGNIKNEEIEVANTGTGTAAFIIFVYSINT